MNSLCGSCLKEQEEKRNDYFLEEIEETAPQTISDIKVNTKNFIVQRNTNVYDVYEKICFLGKGAFGSVYKVKRKNSNRYEIIRALKEISKDALFGSEEEIRNEIEVLKNLDHPNIMKIFEFFEDDKNIYLINEFCGGGDVAGLNNKFGNFPEFLLKYFMFQVFLLYHFYMQIK